MKRVQLTETKLFPANPPEIAEAVLLRPRLDGDVMHGVDGTWSLLFEGWVLPKEESDVAIELVSDGRALAMLDGHRPRHDVAATHLGLAHAADCGFLARVNALRFPPEFEISVEVVMEDDWRMPLASVRGRRHVLGSGYEPRLQPLLITSLGRSGSTALVGILTAHPQVVTYGAAATESNLVNYWSDVVMTLADPLSLRAQVAAVRDQSYPGWSADLRVLSSEMPAYGEDELQRMIGTEGIEALVAFAQQRVDAFYTATAAAAGKPDAVYFAEKSRPEPLNSVATFMEAYPKGREIVLVRDFRDTFCSWRAFANRRRLHIPGMVGDEAWIRFRAERTDEMLSHWKRRAADAHLVKYEDLVTDTAATARGILAYLGPDGDGATIDALVGAYGSRPPELAEHGTSASVADSIGRWQRELDGSLRELCNESFGPALEAFGYEL